MSDPKKKILDATLDVIARETINGTRMRNIAREAGVCQSNLHYYFNTKDELLQSLFDTLLTFFQTRREESRQDREEMSFSEEIELLFQQKKDLIAEKKIDSVQFDFWLQSIVHKELRPKMREFFGVWREEIQSSIDRGVKNEDLNPEFAEMLPYLMVSLMMGASLQSLIGDNIFDLDRYFDTAKTIIERALKAPSDG